MRAPAIVVLLFLLTTPLVTMTKAQDTPRTVSVSGEGIVSAEPDQAVVRFGIVTKHENPEEARARNAAASREAMNAVRELGVDERKMRLETLRLEPENRYDQASRQYIQIGFQATRQVVVTVEDLDVLPTLVARIVQKGANQLQGISYELADHEKAKHEALVKAAANARMKAELLASTLGAELGPVWTVSEQGFQVPRPGIMLNEMSAMRAADAAPEPDAYAAGEIEVRATVSVTFLMR